MDLMVVKNITKNFGGLTAVRDVSFNIQEGQIKSLIGPNGSGKTTIVNLITRLENVNRGSVRFLGHELLNCPAHHIRGLGIARTFQECRTLNDLTALENVLLGLYSQTKSGMLDGILRTRRQRKEEKEGLQKAYEALKLIGIGSVANRVVGSLSLVNRKWVEIARAIVTKPKLLIMDEPAAGLDANEINELVDLIYRFKEEGITIFLIEHHLPLVMGISDEVIVLEFGTKIADALPKEVSSNRQVIAAYLGESESGFAKTI
jgi:branched-chain amino acid transport system ATP-binding protein